MNDRRARRSARALFCAAVLAFEVPVVLFGALVAFAFRDPAASVAPIWGVAGAAALLCLAAAGLVRKRVGVWLGSAIQGLLVLSGVAVPMMFAVGAIFAALWVIAILLGGRIDRERAERATAEDRLAS